MNLLSQDSSWLQVDPSFNRLIESRVITKVLWQNLQFRFYILYSDFRLCLWESPSHQESLIVPNCWRRLL